MRWIRYSANKKIAYGILEGDRIIEVNGDPFNGYEKTSTVRKLADVTFEIPVVPPTFYCAGRNYVTHLKEMAAKRGQTPVIPTKPDMGYRANNALWPHLHDVIIPADATEKVQYEGELVCVVGKKAKNLSEKDAFSCLLGYTIGNDVSERTWQASDATFWRAKNCDTWKPMGPWIETDLDLDKAETICSVNGKETGRFHTNGMLFGIATFIAAMTRYLTLYPGDVIWMGTDGAPPDLVDGDVVDIEITGLGKLTNKFVKAKS
jgi:2-keto-4-pentenoate hydratase/2-oxohepta-3-ene-1,7-dioic acid hydratase in catechol pathway